MGSRGSAPALALLAALAALSLQVIAAARIDVATCAGKKGARLTLDGTGTAGTRELEFEFTGLDALFNTAAGRAAGVPAASRVGTGVGSAAGTATEALIDAALKSAPYLWADVVIEIQEATTLRPVAAADFGRGATPEAAAAQIRPHADATDVLACEWGWGVADSVRSAACAWLHCRAAYRRAAVVVRAQSFDCAS
jgi:hypothetical protein